MNIIFPNKLRKNDKVMIIAPSSSYGILSQEVRDIALTRFATLGLNIELSNNIEEINEFNSSSISSRISDIHNAFSDKSIKAIVTAIGGFNSNQLLNYLDWELIKNNPKIFCGFSDITALNNAILKMTGLVTYSGPHFSTLGQISHLEYTLEYLEKCLFNNHPFIIEPSHCWTDDRWYRDQNDRHPVENEGYWVINKGSTRGTIIGGNLCTLNLLQGTPYFPDIKDSILFIEDDSRTDAATFDRDLQSLINIDAFHFVKGIVIGRFQKGSEVNKELLIKIIEAKQELTNLPIIANVDFGHTDPKITYPIGGEVSITSNSRTIISIDKF